MPIFITGLVEKKYEYKVFINIKKKVYTNLKHRVGKSVILYYFSNPKYSAYSYGLQVFK